MPQPAAQPNDPEPDLKVCWVCREDENDDTPTSSPWRSPCSCKLQAHEACLLDWVAELEKPGPASVAKQKVECPQCKTPIKITRPRSLFLNGLRRFQRIQGLTIIPLCFAILGGGLVTSLYSHGATTVYVVFGAEDAARILAPPDLPAYKNLVHYALPFVPASLLLSRTSIGDRFLSLMPLAYLFLPTPDRSTPLWPPSASLTLIALPFIRMTYNTIYKFLFAKKEQAWLRELQPRGGEGNTDGGNGQADQNAGVVEEGNMNIEFGIQVEVVEEEEEEDEALQEVLADVQGQQGAQDRPAADAQGQRPQEEVLQGQPAGQDAPDVDPVAAQLAPPPQQNAQQNQNGNGLNAANALPIIINVILEKAVGALVFPAIASGIGHALNALLPPTWTKPTEIIHRSFAHKYFDSSTKTTTGFLQTTFGRSIAGGLLFVVLRDSLGLYAKYSLAVQHRKRSIADYEARREAGS